jgi:hypothetical protein
MNMESKIFDIANKPDHLTHILHCYNALVNKKIDIAVREVDILSEVYNQYNRPREKISVISVTWYVDEVEYEMTLPDRKKRIMLLHLMHLKGLDKVKLHDYISQLSEKHAKVLMLQVLESFVFDKLETKASEKNLLDR